MFILIIFLIKYYFLIFYYYYFFFHFFPTLSFIFSLTHPFSSSSLSSSSLPFFVLFSLKHQYLHKWVSISSSILPEWVSSLICAGLPFCTTTQAHGCASFRRHMFFDGFSLGILFQLSIVFFLMNYSNVRHSLFFSLS